MTETATDTVCGASYLTYLRDGHRDDACREAWRIHCAAQKAKRVAKGLRRRDPRHGKATTYTNWNCRCPRCVRAHNDAKG